MLSEIENALHPAATLQPGSGRLSFVWQSRGDTSMVVGFEQNSSRAGRPTGNMNTCGCLDAFPHTTPTTTVSFLEPSITVSGLPSQSTSAILAELTFQSTVVFNFRSAVAAAFEPVCAEATNPRIKTTTGMVKHFIALLYAPGLANGLEVRDCTSCAAHAIFPRLSDKR